MSIMIPNAIEAILINAYIARNPPWSLRLYSNNRVPAGSNVAADYTQVTGGGYAAKSLALVNWVVAAGAPTTATYPIQSFTFTGPVDSPGTIYGYYIIDNAGELVAAERFDPTPFVAQLNGVIITVTPRIAFASSSGD